MKSGALLILAMVAALCTVLIGCNNQDAALRTQVDVQATKIAQLETTAMPASTPTPMASPTARPTKAVAQLVREVGPSVVLVRVGDGTGTGFAAFEAGEVLTAFHVVGSIDARPTVVTSDGTEYRAIVLGADEERDIALLIVPRLDVSPLPLANEVSTGDAVIAVGYALGLSGEPSITRGIVSARRVLPEHGVTLIQTDAPINQGNSGGPLLNEAGEVVGVSVMKLWNNEAAIEGFGFAVSMDDVRRASEALRSGTVATPAEPTAIQQTYDRTLTGEVRYIGNTGGSGVRLRTACSDSSTGSGGWPEGARVTIDYASSGCLGWFGVIGPSGTFSWVRGEYLLVNPPPTPIPSPTLIPAPKTAPTPVNRPPSLSPEMITFFREYAAIMRDLDGLAGEMNGTLANWKQGQMSSDSFVFTMSSHGNRLRTIGDRMRAAPYPNDLQANGVFEHLAESVLAYGWSSIHYVEALTAAMTNTNRPCYTYSDGCLDAGLRATAEGDFARGTSEKNTALQLYNQLLAKYGLSQTP